MRTQYERRDARGHKRIIMKEWDKNMDKLALKQWKIESKRSHEESGVIWWATDNSAHSQVEVSGSMCLDRSARVATDNKLLETIVSEMDVVRGVLPCSVED